MSVAREWNKLNFFRRNPTSRQLPRRAGWGDSLTLFSAQPLILCIEAILCTYGVMAGQYSMACRIKMSRLRPVWWKCLLVGVELLPLNWTYWHRLRSNTHTFRRSLGPLASLYVWGRWKLLGGVEIGSVSRVLGWYVMSGRSGLETTRHPTFTCGIALIRLMRTNLWSHPCSSLPVLYIFGLLMSSIGLL